MSRAVCLIAVMLFQVAPLCAQEAWLGQSGVTRWVSGDYSYRKLSTGEENGSEDFLLVVNDDGARTLRSTNAFIDRMEIWRHAVYRVDTDFRPLDLYMNYTTAGKWRGNGFFRIEGRTMKAQVNGPSGYTEAEIELPEKFSLIPHPIATNSWPAWYYDHDRGGAQPVALYSFDGRASDEDGILGQIQNQTISYEGKQTIRVPAGEFETNKYVFNDGDPQIYLHGPDQLIVKMVWELADVQYLLTRYQTGPESDGGKQ